MNDKEAWVVPITEELELPEHIAKEINDCHEELEHLRADKERLVLELLDLVRGYHDQSPSLWRVEEILTKELSVVRALTPPEPSRCENCNTEVRPNQQYCDKCLYIFATQ